MIKNDLNFLIVQTVLFCIIISFVSSCKFRTYSVVEGKDYELSGDIRREKLNDTDEYIVYIDVKLYEEKGKAVLDEIAERVCFETNKRWAKPNSHIVRFYLEDKEYAVIRLNKNCYRTE